MSKEKELTPEDIEALTEVLTFTDDDGNEVNFQYLAMIPYEGEHYIVLLPADDPDDTDVLILKVEEIPGNDEEENYVDVGDEELLEKLFQIFMQDYADSI